MLRYRHFVQNTFTGEDMRFVWYMINPMIYLSYHVQYRLLSRDVQ